MHLGFETPGSRIIRMSVKGRLFAAQQQNTLRRCVLYHKMD